MLQGSAIDRQVKAVFPQTFTHCPAHIFIQWQIQCHCQWEKPQPRVTKCFINRFQNTV